MNRWAMVALVTAQVALAQTDLEIDLTSPPAEGAKDRGAQKTTPADQSEEGLDVTAPTQEVPLELRPTLLVLGAIPQTDGDESTEARARAVEDEILRLASAGKQFRVVVEPESVRAMGIDPRACTEKGCVDQAARAVKAQRVIRAGVKKTGAGTQVSLTLFDRALPELVAQTHEFPERAERSFAGMAGKSTAQRNRDFLRKATPWLAKALSAVATPNGKLVVDNIDSTAPVLVDGVEAGRGSFEMVIERGKHRVSVTTPGYQPFEKEIAIEALASEVVKVVLVAKPVEVPRIAAAPMERPTPFYARPGLYVVLVGLGAVAAGAILGAQAKQIETAALQKDENGLAAVTRLEARRAPSQALLANILMGAGGAVAAGGGLWFLLTPTRTESPAPPSVKDGEASYALGLMFAAGGRF